MRRLSLGVCALALALLAAAPFRALLVRDRPSIALVCAVAAVAAAALSLAAVRLRVPPELLAVVLLPLAMAWGLGEGLSLFSAVPRWDLLTHAAAGLSLGALAALLSVASPFGLRRPLVAALFVTFAVGFGWELGEWACDALLGTRTSLGVRNAALDLAADLAGGALGAALLAPALSRSPAVRAVQDRWRRAAASAASRIRRRSSGGLRSSAAPSSDSTIDAR